jgi:general secretion pathway protein N
MNAADRRRLSPTLGIVAGVLLLALILLWVGVGRGAGWHDDAAPPKLPPADSVLPAPTVAPLDQYALVWQHPLFSPDRQPQPVAGGDGAAASDLTLTGVILVPGLKMAIVHDKSSNRDYRLVEGQPPREGPALVDLQARSAVVEASGGRVQLQLVPAASPDAGNSIPEQGGATGTSGNVTPRTTAGETPQAAQAQAAARARALKARIEAERRRAEQHGGG